MCEHLPITGGYCRRSHRSSEFRRSPTPDHTRVDGVTRSGPRFAACDMRRQGARRSLPNRCGAYGGCMCSAACGVNGNGWRRWTLICCPWLVWRLPEHAVWDGKGNRFMETRPIHSDGRPLLSNEQSSVGGTHDSWNMRGFCLRYGRSTAWTLSRVFLYKERCPILNLLTSSSKNSYPFYQVYWRGGTTHSEGARFETPTAAETIDIDLLLSFRSQSLTDESELEEKSIETDGTR